MRHRFSILFATVSIAATLCGCGGGGAGGNGGASSSSTSSQPAKSARLFAAVGNPGAIASIPTLAPAAGILSLDQIITYPSTDLTGSHINGLEIDPATDRLFVSGTRGLQAFAAASTTKGNAVPIWSVGTSVWEFRNMHLDLTNRRLYAIERYQGIMTFSLDGEPVRIGNPLSVSVGYIPTFSFMAIDTKRDIAYVVVCDKALTERCKIAAIDRFSTQQGYVKPSRLMPITTNYSSTSIVLDVERDTLYIAPWDGAVMAYANMSTRTDIVTPDRTFKLPILGPFVYSLKLDAEADRLYVAYGGALEIVDRVSSATGTISPLAIMAPSQTSELSAVAFKK